MKKFDVEFKKLTDNKYPFVRFVRAEYSVSDNNLICIFWRLPSRLTAAYFPTA